MVKSFLIILSLTTLSLTTLTACKTVPVTKEFPRVPEKMLEEPETPSMITEQDTLLSDMLPVIIDNNSVCTKNYYLLKGWQAWYHEQKKLHK